MLVCKLLKMGQTLSEPVTKKQSESCENEKYKVGSSSMQGWRVSMEDAHTHILQLPDDNEASFFAVYDGHGGSVISKHSANNLHKLITQQAEYKVGDIPTAMTKAFLEFDAGMQNDNKLKNEVSGTTAVTCLIKGNKLFCGNVGDSRAVACINGKAEALSFDHKPGNPIEINRIKEAGGFVEFNRVNGNLALSRALGDFSFKRNTKKSPEEQMVIALPDIEERTISKDWEFILLACDGIWDVITNEEACELVRYPLGNGLEPEKVCEELLQACLAPDCQMGGLGCDNMTAVLICLLHEQSWSDYCSKIASSLDSSMLESTRTTQGFSFDLSSSDDDDVILPHKLGEAKSVAASLCTSLSTKTAALKLTPPVLSSPTESESLLQKILQTPDYVYKGDTAAEKTITSNSSIRTTTTAELIAGVDAEILTPPNNTSEAEGQNPSPPKATGKNGKNEEAKNNK